MIRRPHRARPAAPSTAADNTTWLWLTASLLVLAVILVRQAWNGEDAYIGWRMTENVALGHGPVWNVGERVQVYSSPLWFLLLITPLRLLTGEVFLTTIAVSLVMALVFAWLCYRRAGYAGAAVGALTLAMLSSKGYMDYTVSGLENPLSHLLLAFFYLAVWDRDRKGGFPGLIALTSLIYLNRADNVLFCLPVLAWEGWLYLQAAWAGRRLLPALSLCLLAGTPVLAWTVFSVVYYGFPFPNTYYFKLDSGIPSSDSFKQGVLYLLYLIDTEPQTLILIALGLAAGIASETWRDRLLAVGAALYMVYVVKVGADYMGGRFVTAPLAAALLLLARPLAGWRPALSLGLGAAALALSLVLPNAPITTDRTYGCIGTHQPAKAYDCPCDDPVSKVSDVRGAYYQVSGLLPNFRRDRADIREFGYTATMRFPIEKGYPFITSYPIGFGGYAARDRIFIYDLFGLADPLLPRMPFRGYSTPFTDWKPGHIFRRIPAGAMRSARTGINHIRNPSAARIWDDMRLITHGPLNAPGRWAAIWRRNTRRPVLDSLLFPIESVVNFDRLPDSARVDGLPGAIISYAITYPLNAGYYRFRIVSDTVQPHQVRVLDANGAPLQPRFDAEGFSFDLELKQPSQGDHCLIYSTRFLGGAIPLTTVFEIDRVR